MPFRPSSGRLLHQNGPPTPTPPAHMKGSLMKQPLSQPLCHSPKGHVICHQLQGTGHAQREALCRDGGSASPEHRTCQTHVPEPQAHARGLSPPHPPLCPPVHVPKARDSPKLGASPHGAVGEGTLTLPNLLREQAGQRREVNPCNKQRTQRLAGAGSPSGQRGVRARLGSSQSHR